MDARTSIEKRPPSRHVTVAVPGGLTNAALHLPAVAHECSKFDRFGAAEIFKKTPYIAGLKPAGRYVAKDMFEVGGVPLLMKTLLDHGHLDDDCLTVTGRTVAENLKSVKWNPHPLVRSADKPDFATGGDRVISLLQDGDIIELDAVIGTLNVKLTGAEPAEGKTKWKPRQTNHRSGALWKYARQVGPAVDGAVTYPGGAHEKQCYADI